MARTLPQPRQFRAAVLASAVAALVGGVLSLGCASSAFQPGFANAENINRPWSSDDYGHDAVANGRESCPPSGRREDDPLAYRFPSCPEVHANAPTNQPVAFPSVWTPSRSTPPSANP